ncbi:CYFA0S07e02102g1_1 [Cyberlindnera fabianii]|uniref:CYFA0S07e02102g1_1 n=2 Tax=Cyberlindnera fabianii TaxID=36022 RepID=A0A061AV30_CYBFA|nr:CYFA0S07e02102g1_1 [Cyberlindnera fabianii]
MNSPGSLSPSQRFLPFNVSTDDLPTLQFPAEIIFKILEFQLHQIMQNNTVSISTNTQMFIRSNLTVCRVFYRCVVKLIYKYCCFKTPHTFEIFLIAIRNKKRLGEYVQVLDFQEFTSIGLGRTGRMNKEIQMVTSTTILESLKHTPNLVEFLASENIKDDLDTELLEYLFNEMHHIRALDFCGCSGELFTTNFNNVIIKKPGILNITDLSFHDCTDLPTECLEKVISNLPNLRKLDLTHTQITSKSLGLIPHTAQLTHLSLAYCIQLTTRELISFFINHPAITCNQLVWLNLQCDSSTTLFNNNQLTFLLKMFDCDFKYLNLGGLPVTFNNLMLIKRKFLNLKAIDLTRCSFTQQEIIDFLSPPPPSPSPSTELDVKTDYFQQLLFIGLAQNNNITRWNLDNPQFLNCSKSLVAFEFTMKIINDIEQIGGKLIYGSASNKTIWKSLDSGGRRGWLFKVDPIKNPDNSKSIGLIEYDIETGEKLFKILKQPEFLKYVNKKISMSKGVLGDANEIFGDLERGIYKYYGMKM